MASQENVFPKLATPFYFDSARKAFCVRTVRNLTGKRRRNHGALWARRQRVLDPRGATETPDPGNDQRVCVCRGVHGVLEQFWAPYPAAARRGTRTTVTKPEKSVRATSQDPAPMHTPVRDSGSLLSGVVARRNGPEQPSDEKRKQSYSALSVDPDAVPYLHVKHARRVTTPLQLGSTVDREVARLLQRCGQIPANYKKQTKRLFELLEKLQWYPVQSQLPVGSTRARVATAIDLVVAIPCVDPGQQNPTRRFNYRLLEIKCGHDAYFQRACGRMKGAFSSIDNTPRNHALLQAAFTLHLAQHESRLPIRDAAVVQLTSELAAVHRLEEWCENTQEFQRVLGVITAQRMK